MVSTHLQVGEKHKKPEQKVHPTVFSLKKFVKIIELVRGIIWRD